MMRLFSPRAPELNPNSIAAAIWGSRWCRANRPSEAIEQFSRTLTLRSERSRVVVRARGRIGHGRAGGPRLNRAFAAREDLTPTGVDALRGLAMACACSRSVPARRSRFLNNARSRSSFLNYAEAHFDLGDQYGIRKEFQQAPRALRHRGRAEAEIRRRLAAAKRGPRRSQLTSIRPSSVFQYGTAAGSNKWASTSESREGTRTERKAGGDAVMPSISRPQPSAATVRVAEAHHARRRSTRADDLCCLAPLWSG